MTLSTQEWLPAFVLALAGSLHCVGMCGGFVLATSVGGGEARKTPSRLLIHQLLYHMGKTMTYVFLGALAGLGGQWVLARAPSYQRGLAIVASLFLFVIALQLLGVSWLGARRFSPSIVQLLARWWVRVGAVLKEARTPLSPLYLGVFTGFLPCPLVYAFLATAAATGSVLAAVLLMTALGVGTIPLLLLVAVSGRALAPLLRTHGVRLAGVAVLALAVYTAYRGVVVHLHCFATG